MNTKSSTSVRKEVQQAVTVMGMSTARSFLSYAGILPLMLADGVRVVVLPDIHAPAHNKQLLWAVKQFLAWYQPHVIFFVGDVADIFGLSGHPKGLRQQVRPQWELEVTREVMDELIEAGGSQVEWVYVILGNHEDRIYRKIQDDCPALGGILDAFTREPINFHTLLGYKATDKITFIYGVEERGGFEGGVLLNNQCGIHHGIIVRPKAGFSPLADMQRWQRSIQQGHTHRLGYGFMDKTARDPFPTGIGTWFELGSLADMNHSYMSYAKKMFPNWHPGFGVGTVHNGVIHMAPVPIRPINHNGQLRLGFEYENSQGQSRIFVESDR